MTINFALPGLFVGVCLFLIHKMWHRRLDDNWMINPNVPPQNGEKKKVRIGRRGEGFVFYGKYRKALVDGRETYVAYYGFSFLLWIPLGAYRMIDNDNVLGSEKTSIQEILCIFLYGISITIIGLSILFFVAEIFQYFGWE